MLSPIISLVNVMNGPVANAGSIFNLFNMRGQAVPNMEANMITLKREMVTVNGIAKDPISKNSVKIKIRVEHIVALINAPPISLMML